MFTCFNVEKHTIFLIPSIAAAPLVSLCLIRFSSCLFKAPLLKSPVSLIGQLSESWAGTAQRVPTSAPSPQEVRKALKPVFIVANYIVMWCTVTQTGFFTVISMMLFPPWSLTVIIPSEIVFFLMYYYIYTVCYIPDSDAVGVQAEQALLRFPTFQTPCLDP